MLNLENIEFRKHKRHEPFTHRNGSETRGTEATVMGRVDVPATLLEVLTLRLVRVQGSGLGFILGLTS